MNNNGEWLFGGVTPDKKFIAQTFQFKGVRADTVGQFTGFYDTQNTEIYEGDIIKFKDVPFVVKWLDRTGRFIVENHMTFLTMANADRYKVVGNIHENPKLFQALWDEFVRKPY